MSVLHSNIHTKLIQFIKEEDLEQVSVLLNSDFTNAEVLQQDDSGLTALHHAIQQCNRCVDGDHVLNVPSFHILERILTSTYGAPLTLIPNDDGELTPLHMCCRNILPDEVIVTVARTNPRALQMQDEDGETPLHSACRYGASDEVLKLLIQLAYDAAGEVLEEDQAFAKVDHMDGEIPIHFAISNNVSAGIIQLLLDAYPQGISAVNCNFQAPLHMACDLGHYETIEVILQSHAATGIVSQLLCLQNQCHLTPLSLSWNRYLEASSQASKNQESLDILETMAFVICVASGRSYLDEGSILESSRYTDDHSFHLLKASIVLGDSIVPRAFVSFLISGHEEILQRADPHGRMPLHIAITLHSVNEDNHSLFMEPKAALIRNDMDKDSTTLHTTNSPLGSSDKEHQKHTLFQESRHKCTSLIWHYHDHSFDKPIYSSEILKLILAAYPEAASIPDRAGNLPLCIAIDSGLRWNDGLKDIFMAYPRAITGLHQDTGFYPFMLAACAYDNEKKLAVELETIYCLLQSSPSLLSTLDTPNENKIESSTGKKCQVSGSTEKHTIQSQMPIAKRQCLF